MVTSGGFLAAAALLLATCSVCLVAAFPQSAQADDKQEAQDALDSKTASLQKVADEVSASSSKVADLEKKIDDLLDDIEDGQTKRIDLQKQISSLSRVMYKNGEQLDLFAIITNSESLSDVLEKTEVRRKVLVQYADLAAEQQRVSSELQVEYREVSARKDEQASELDALKQRKEELSAAVAELQGRVDELDAQERAALAAAAAAAETAAANEAEAEPQPAAGEQDSNGGSKENGSAKNDKSEGSGGKSDSGAGASGGSGGWQTGIASAYGGSSDSVKDSISATGTAVNDWSMGVAVPIAWGPSAYYGRSVEISYGGVSVVATVVDCGDMGGGSRSLDLQPGVFKALGFKTCNDWGLREVQYRFL